MARNRFSWRLASALFAVKIPVSWSAAGCARGNAAARLKWRTPHRRVGMTIFSGDGQRHDLRDGGCAGANIGAAWGPAGFCR